MKNLKTKAVTILTILAVTAGFAGAEYAAGTPENFPYFHLGTLIVAGLIISGLKFKYDKMTNVEVVGAMSCYALLISMFTEPVIMAIKTFVG